MSLPGHRLGKQGFSGSRRSHQQCALGKLGAYLGIFPGIVQEIHHFLQRFLGLLLARHILKGYAGLFLDVNLGLALAHTHAHHTAAAHFPHNQAENSPQKQYRKDHIDKYGEDQRPHILHLRLITYTGLGKLLLQLVIRDNPGIIRRISSHGSLCLGYNGNLLGGNLNAFNVSLLQHLHKFVVSDGRFAGTHISGNHLPNHQAHQRHNQ